jgi:hypothetical protein
MNSFYRHIIAASCVVIFSIPSVVLASNTTKTSKTPAEQTNTQAVTPAPATPTADPTATTKTDTPADPAEALEQEQANQKLARTTEKFFYTNCQKELLTGMKQGISDNKEKTEAQHLLNDPAVIRQMESLAEEVCRCAAPRFNKVVLSQMDKPTTDETRKLFERTAYDSIMDCAAASKNPLLQKKGN